MASHMSQPQDKRLSSHIVEIICELDGGLELQRFPLSCLGLAIVYMEAKASNLRNF
jgi:hypothetical protein